MHHYSILWIADHGESRYQSHIEAIADSGYRTLLSSPANAFGYYWDTMPDIIIDEVGSQCLNEQTIVKIHKTMPDVPVIVISSNAPEVSAVLGCVRCGAQDYLYNPDSEELLQALESAVLRLSRSYRNNLVLKQLVEERREFLLDNSIDLIHAVISSLMPAINTFCTAKCANEIRMALFEILLNAIEHGNLDIGYEEKNRALDEGSYQELFHRQIKRHGHRKVRFVAIFRRNIFTFVVEDEGSGFDVKGLPDPRDAENLLRTSGRGILMSYYYMDRMQYNAVGNRVILAKKADKVCAQKPQRRRKKP
ncbi:ATP-binding response regulator [Desulfurispira natronophila]|uniref:Anti-sigma regulatory factor (Ser/Thr protein kinase)/CheY-like chemotaxis protein n=1 Tax=Desulfurispira natronophila TaxID=682562 RepID=A0A7W8DH74_9BACT|nr:ATP-binding protein [Desulfurispira natronophila]MBB5022200.1 anti-sigma regulatory factor (Ser/Thr protein kinase)/CheY-like chemotaxis protein [Desulfurispira natronophila]